MIKTLPVLMRGKNHEPVKVGNAQYNDLRKTLTLRVDLDMKAGEEMEILGQAIEMGLIDAMKLGVIESAWGAEVVEASENDENPTTEETPNA